MNIYFWIHLGFVVVLATVHGFNKHAPISVNTVLPGNTEEGISIYDGKTTTIKKHPYLVRVQLGESRFCTGAIVSERWVLTTADCAQHSPENIKVLMNRRYNKVLKVKNVTLHPSYPGNVYDYDFACLQIKGRFHFSKGVRPVRLPGNTPVSDSVMVVTAWGEEMILSRNKSHAEPLEGKMIWMSDSLCNSTLSSMGVVRTDRIACAYHHKHTTLCSGGWGAPFVQRGVLYGQFVGADALGFCSAKASPVILSNIASVASWVHNVTGAEVDQN